MGMIRQQLVGSVQGAPTNRPESRLGSYFYGSSVSSGSNLFLLFDAANWRHNDGFHWGESHV
jgi:hypothetical protein